MTFPLVTKKSGFATIDIPRFAQGSKNKNISPYHFKNFEAATIKVSEESRILNSKSLQDVKTIEQQDAPQKSIFDNVIESLGKITEQIRNVENILQDSTLSFDQRAAYLQEKFSLGESFKRITGSDDYKRLQETLTSIQGSLASGASSQSLLNSLGSNAQQIGSGVLGLVSYGNSSGLNDLSNILSNISDASESSFSNEDLNYIGSQLSAAKKLLSGPIKEFREQVVEQKQQEAQSTISPETQDIQYVSDEKFAIALKGYSGKGLISAAASGLDLGSSDISKIVITVPKNESEINDYDDNNNEDPQNAPTLNVFA